MNHLCYYCLQDLDTITNHQHIKSCDLLEIKLANGEISYNDYVGNKQANEELALRLMGEK